MNRNALAVSEVGRCFNRARSFAWGESGAVTTGLTVLAYGGSFLGTATLGLSLYVGVSGRTFKASDLDRFYPVRRFDGFRVYALARVPLLTMSSSVSRGDAFLSWRFIWKFVRLDGAVVVRGFGGDWMASVGVAFRVAAGVFFVRA